ncbi:hypothetical protein AB9K26_07060 [Psychroserpens sp. XS_ASV72]|uniref:hypothetical protein n=1 Tax=Psychroserpens sp. XS_ASV72 TaxID=3241293 RepID=UPI003519D51C
MSKLRRVAYSLTVFLALLILTDFAFPGKIINDRIRNVDSDVQQYYNAAKNYHYTYKVITSEHEFMVTEDFAELELTNKKIEYSVSRIFKDVNWYRLPPSESKSFYSLRIYSGLVLPLLAIIAIFIVYRFKKDIVMVVLILQILLIADLIFLIL